MNGEEYGEEYDEEYDEAFGGPPPLDDDEDDEEEEQERAHYARFASWHACNDAQNQFMCLETRHHAAATALVTPTCLKYAAQRSLAPTLYPSRPSHALTQRLHHH